MIACVIYNLLALTGVVVIAYWLATDDDQPSRHPHVYCDTCCEPFLPESYTDPRLCPECTPTRNRHAAP